MQKAPARRSVSTGSFADSRSSCSSAKRSTACNQTHFPSEHLLHIALAAIFSLLLYVSSSSCGTRPVASVSLSCMGCPTVSRFKASARHTVAC